MEIGKEEVEKILEILEKDENLKTRLASVILNKIISDYGLRNKLSQSFMEDLRREMERHQR